MGPASVEDQFVRVAAVSKARETSPTVVQAGGRSIALFFHDDAFYAIDNRCPHMGFPLTKGTVEDGILTCHWHHARFELSCGDTFDPFADDVQTFPVDIRDDAVYVNPHPSRDQPPAEHWTDRLEHGLREDLSLVIAKSVIGLEDTDVPHADVVWIGTDFGTRYREAGWGQGLTTLSVMANLLDDIRPDDYRRALYVGLSEVADDCAGEAPYFVQEPLSAGEVSVDRLQSWFRDNIEVRDADGAERVLRTAIQAGHSKSIIATFLVAAATDHRYLDNGHRLDFIVKAFDLLDLVGWQRADRVLPSLVPGLAAASRAEERSSWRQPIDVAALLAETFEKLPGQVVVDTERSWSEPTTLLDTILADDPHAIIDALVAEIEQGATAEALGSVVVAAAAHRIAQFGTANEFSDWNTVHHTYSYANAVCGAARRTNDWVVYRGVLDAAISVYLDRFLNTPPTPIPDHEPSERDAETILEDLTETFEVERTEEVNRAGALTAEYLDADHDIGTLKEALGEVLLREDAGFHTRQNLEAAFDQFDRTRRERGRVHLIATARYLAAHTPTRRSSEQTFRIAERLHRGERIHEA